MHRLTATRRQALLGCITLCVLLLGHRVGLAQSPSDSSRREASRPNVLIIIADDLGFSDLGCYGGEIETPHLNGLAAAGIRFTHFYNTSRCWPTRSSLMTGYYPQQIRRDGVAGAPLGYGGGGKRPAWAKTLAQRLQAVGYRTYHSGKWHIDGDPTQNGFDRSNPTSRGPGFFDPVKRKNRDPDFYRTIATADHAIECLQQHAADFSRQPFFQYVAFHAPHFPLHAPPEHIAKYRGKYADGWDALRKRRYDKQREIGLNLAELSPLEPDVGPPYAFPEQLQQLGPGEINRPLAWADLNEAQQRFQAIKMTIHAAMVDRMDQEIGRILDQLREMSAMNDTLICFLSDNGASAEIMVRGDGHDPDAAPGSAATYLCLGPGFSSACNTPFRRHKTWVHEGGISTPFLVHWPAGLKTSERDCDAVAHVIDMVPTVLDLAGIDASEIQPSLPGRSLRPIFEGQPMIGHDELWFAHEGNYALRQGNWKVIRSNISRPFPWRRRDVDAAILEDPKTWKLYNMNADRAEQQDRSTSHPAKQQAMIRRWVERRDEYLKTSKTNETKHGRHQRQND